MNPYVIKAGTNVSLVESPGFPFNTVTISATGTGGTTDHTLLTNRDANDQHPQSAITGLVTSLGGKVDDSQVLTDVPSGALFTDTTYVSSDFDHDQLTGFVSGEHYLQSSISITAGQVSDFDAEVDAKIDDITAVDVGAVPSAGGTFTGSVTIQNNAPGIYLMEADTVDDNWFIVANASGLSFQLRDDAKGYLSTPFRVYSTGYITARLGTLINEFSTDGTLAGNSDDAVPTERAVKTYVDSTVSALSTDSLEAMMVAFS